MCEFLGWILFRCISVVLGSFSRFLLRVCIDSYEFLIVTLLDFVPLVDMVALQAFFSWCPFHMLFRHVWFRVYLFSLPKTFSRCVPYRRSTAVVVRVGTTPFVRFPGVVGLVSCVGEKFSPLCEGRLYNRVRRSPGFVNKSRFQ